MTEAAINSTVTRDLYVAMGEQLPGGDWIIRFWYKPFIGWIWGGCLIMMIGGVLATTDRRYRARQGATVAASGTAGSTA